MQDDIRSIARRTFEDIFPRCDVEALRAVTDPDVVHHGARPDEPPGFEGVKETMLWLASVFSNQRWEVHDAIVEGDKVVLRLTHHGTHTGPLPGGIAPTGRTVAYDSFQMFRFRDGKAVEHWGMHDGLQLMRQLGITSGAPAPATAPADAVAARV